MTELLIFVYQAIDHIHALFSTKGWFIHLINSSRLSS